MFVDFEAMASDVLRHAPHRLASGAIDVERIITEYAGFALERVADLREDGRKLLGACYFREDKIAIEANGYAPRLRFTMAHELGHALIDFRGGRPSSMTAYRCAKSDIEAPLVTSEDQSERIRSGRPRFEYLADGFAAALLMPRSEVLEFLSTRREHLIAARFEVSREAANYRIATLKALTLAGEDKLNGPT